MVETKVNKVQQPTYYAIKSEGGYYYNGLNQFVRELRSAKLYKSLKRLEETRKDKKFKNIETKVVKVRVEEVGEVE